VKRVEGEMDSGSGTIKKHRVFVVDDHPIVRYGLGLLINGEKDLMVCGEAENALAALESIRASEATIIIVDISLNGPDGLDLLKDLRTTYPHLPILILSMHDEFMYAERALRASARGYVMKQDATETVLVALRRILNGEIYVSDRISDRMVQRYIRSRAAGQPASVADLTDRELEVFRLIGEGHSTRQIADVLHISVKTVESYQAHIKEKLSLRSGRELVQHAIQWSVGGKTA
jgi:DNA-binding NarL/FixJ family response regulator